MSTAKHATDIPADVVRAALEAAKTSGKDVADVPLIEIARAAGVSRSTLLRRLGGTRSALNAAVQEAGVDPGGRAPVRERATHAAAELIDERGLAGVTLEAVAIRADCSVHSLYAAFGGRDELLRAVFDRFGPVLHIEEAIADPQASFQETVHRVYQQIAEVFGREPRVIPAMLAELMARPNEAATRALVQHTAPRMLGSLGRWLSDGVTAGHIKDLPLPLLIQQMIGPVVMHTALRPVAPEVGLVLPELQQTCAIFAEAFLCAVGTSSKAPGQPEVLPG